MHGGGGGGFYDTSPQGLGACKRGRESENLKICVTSFMNAPNENRLS